MAASVGAALNPWMPFYQQSATAQRGLGAEALRAARWDTALGAVLTQLVTAAMLVAAAATIGTGGPRGGLEGVGEISRALVVPLGPAVGRAVFGVGVIAAAAVAAVVACLALGWGVDEATRRAGPLDGRKRRAVWGHALCSLGVAGAAVVVGASADLVALNLAVQVANALLLPLLLGLLVALALTALPRPHRPRGAYLVVVIGTVTAVCALGVLGAAGALW